MRLCFNNSANFVAVVVVVVVVVSLLSLIYCELPEYRNSALVRLDSLLGIVSWV